MKPPTSRVILRNGQQACLTGLSFVSPYHVFGYILTEAGPLESLWHQEGEWREDKTTHALDIVALINEAGVRIHLKSTLK